MADDEEFGDVASGVGGVEDAGDAEDTEKPKKVSARKRKALRAKQRRHEIAEKAEAHDGLLPAYTQPVADQERLLDKIEELQVSLKQTLFDLCLTMLLCFATAEDAVPRAQENGVGKEGRRAIQVCVYRAHCGLGW